MERRTASFDTSPLLRENALSSSNCSFFATTLSYLSSRSEALRKSIANRGLYGAESKDPEDEYVVDAVWRFFFKTPTKSSS
jgi:hypothetical protein